MTKRTKPTKFYVTSEQTDMAIITAYDRLGFGLNMVDTNSSFIPGSNLIR